MWCWTDLCRMRSGLKLEARMLLMATECLRYHPPKNFRSQDKMFLELISLCKCNFSSFHNYFFVQVQVGVLPELIFKQVVYASAFFVYSRILGYSIRTAPLQRGFGGDFCPGKSQSLSRCCLGCDARSS